MAIDRIDWHWDEVTDVVSERNNKFDVYEEHIEIKVFKLFVMRK